MLQKQCNVLPLLKTQCRLKLRMILWLKGRKKFQHCTGFQHTWDFKIPFPDFSAYNVTSEWIECDHCGSAVLCGGQSSGERRQHLEENRRLDFHFSLILSPTKIFHFGCDGSPLHLKLQWFYFSIILNRILQKGLQLQMLSFPYSSLCLPKFPRPKKSLIFNFNASPYTFHACVGSLSAGARSEVNQDQEFKQTRRVCDVLLSCRCHDTPWKLFYLQTKKLG